MLQLVLFFVFGIIAVAAAVNLLAQRHPINSALSLIVVMASLAALFLLLGAEFVAAIQVIVYAGAIMVLFVFVIMLLNAGEEERTPGSRVAMLLGFPAVVLLAGLLGVDAAYPQPTSRYGGPQRALCRLAHAHRATALSGFPAAVRSHLGADPDRHHGRGGAGQSGRNHDRSRQSGTPPAKREG